MYLRLKESLVLRGGMQKNKNGELVDELKAVAGGGY